MEKYLTQDEILKYIEDNTYFSENMRRKIEKSSKHLCKTLHISELLQFTKKLMILEIKTARDERLKELHNKLH